MGFEKYQVQMTWLISRPNIFDSVIQRDQVLAKPNIIELIYTLNSSTYRSDKMSNSTSLDLATHYVQIHVGLVNC